MHRPARAGGLPRPDDVAGASIDTPLTLSPVPTRTPPSALFRLSSMARSTKPPTIRVAREEARAERQRAIGAETADDAERRRHPDRRGGGEAVHPAVAPRA